MATRCCLAEFWRIYLCCGIRRCQDEWSGLGREFRVLTPRLQTPLVVPAHGVSYTIVNGEILYENQRHTGALPGQVLRS
jgi:hypothetical protein